MSSDNTIEMVKRALDASLMRQTAIANNIANTNSLDYQTIEVDFEAQLADANEWGGSDLSSVAPHYQLAKQHASIDEQMALNVKNITQYRALIKGLNQKLAIMNIALQGNNQ